MTTPPRRTSPPSRTTRRSRRPAQRSAGFLERHRTTLLWLVGGTVFALLVVVGFVLPAVTPAYSCDNAFDPTPAPTWVAPSPVPVASGASPAPAVTPPPLGYVQPDMGHPHEVNPAKPINYTYCPPASGKHYNASGLGPIEGGLYGPDEPTRPGGWVHNLEHGAIVLLYNCTLAPEACTDAGQQAFQTMLAKWPASPVCNFPRGSIYQVVTRFDDMPYPYAAIVWDVVLPLDTPDEALIFDFYARQGEQFNPERPSNCVIPTPTPGPTPTAGPTSTVAPSAVPSAAPSTGPAPSGSAAPVASPTPASS